VRSARGLRRRRWKKSSAIVGEESFELVGKREEPLDVLVLLDVAILLLEMEGIRRRGQNEMDTRARQSREEGQGIGNISLAEPGLVK
jgi:hypothetical protein